VLLRFPRKSVVAAKERADGKNSFGSKRS
jgi:hypothetical protein